MGVKFLSFLLYVLASIYVTQCYVLIKVLPSNKFEEVIEYERRQFNDYTKYTVKRDQKDNVLESIVFAVNTAEGDLKNQKTDPFIQNIENLINSILDSNIVKTRRNFEIYSKKAQVVNINNGQRAVTHEINLEKIIAAVNDFILSKTFKIYSPDLIQMVTTIYTNMKEQLVRNDAIV